MNECEEEPCSHEDPCFDEESLLDEYPRSDDEYPRLADDMRPDEKFGWLPHERLAVSVRGDCCARVLPEFANELYLDVEPADLGAFRAPARFAAEFDKYEFLALLR